MIEFTKGNLLEADVEALVNTVNTVGVMGKGIALQFRQAFPENYEAYKKACKCGEVKIGKMFVVATGRLTNPRYIINFPTKRHWRSKSRIEDIQKGLEDLVRLVKKKNIRSIAIPPLGCGFGGLRWEDVRPLIVKAFESLPDVRVLIYEPYKAPAADQMKIATRRPRLTKGRAALIVLIDRYAIPGYRLTHLEIQKLAYFLQSSGEPLRLNYVKHKYGPYAENLHFVLQRLEGHYLRGYGDRSRRAEIYLLPGAQEEAEAFLQNYPETLQRIDRVARLIYGFETPYGMELLATVHWLAQEDPAVRENYQAAIEGFRNWNAHKRKRFRPDHIRVAWEHLRKEGWI